MLRRLRRAHHILIPLALIVLAVGVRVSVPQVEEMRMRVFDVYQRLAPREYVPVPVKYVDLDDESLERIGQWPWPRTFVAQLVAQLANAGAAAIVFDIVFCRTRPDLAPIHRRPVAAHPSEVEALKENMDDLPDHDAVLADVIAQSPVITGFVLTGDPSLPRLPGNRQPHFAYGGDDPLEVPLRLSGRRRQSLRFLTENASGNGSFNLVAERDGIVRRVPMFLRLEGQSNPYPSLTAEVLRVIQGARTYIIKTTGASGEVGYGGVKTRAEQYQDRELSNSRPARTAACGFTSPGTSPSGEFPAWQVFSPDFDPETG